MGEAKSILARVKLEILQRMWAGERITHIARDCGVSRQVIYVWKKKAEKAVLRTLQARKRGPKAQNIAEARVNGYGQVRGETLPPEGNTPARGSQSSSPVYKASQAHSTIRVPERCPVCGCEKIYRNGTYARKVSGGGHKKMAKTRKMQIVQRYICVWCKNSVT